MAKLKHLTRHRASKDAIEAFCVLNNLVATPGKKGKYRYYIVIGKDDRWRFSIGRTKPIEAWVRAYNTSVPKIMLHTATHSGRWSGKNHAMSYNKRSSWLMPTFGGSLKQNLVQTVAFREYAKIDARVMAVLSAKIDLQAHLTDAMAYGHAVLPVFTAADFAHGNPVPDAPRSVRSSGADGVHVDAARPKFLGITRLPYRRAVAGRHRYEPVRSELESRHDQGYPRPQRSRRTRAIK